MIKPRWIKGKLKAYCPQCNVLVELRGIKEQDKQTTTTGYSHVWEYFAWCAKGHPITMLSRQKLTDRQLETAR